MERASAAMSSSAAAAVALPAAFGPPPGLGPPTEQIEREADWEAYAKRIRRDSRMETAGLEREEGEGSDVDEPDLAVDDGLGHYHPHEPMKRAPAEPGREFDEDDGTPLDPDQVKQGVQQELEFMEELGVGGG